jgi:hypothetical protein
MRFRRQKPQVSRARNSWPARPELQVRCCYRRRDERGGSDLFELTDSGGPGGLGCYFFCVRPTRKRDPSLAMLARDEDPSRILVFFGESEQSRSALAGNAHPPARSFASVTSILSWCSTAAASDSAISATLALRSPEPQRYGLYFLVVDFRARRQPIAAKCPYCVS